MIRFKIEVETYHSIWYEKKEYESLAQCRKALKMKNFARYSKCVVRLYKFVDEKGILIPKEVYVMS